MVILLKEFVYIFIYDLILVVFFVMKFLFCLTFYKIDVKKKMLIYI